MATLSAPKQRAIEALLTCNTLTSAAVESGISTATLRRWRKDPTFLGAYQQASRAVALSVQAKIQADALVAAETVTVIMQDEQVHPSTRLKAAGLLLDLTFRGLGMLNVTPAAIALKEPMQLFPFLT